MPKENWVSLCPRQGDCFETTPLTRSRAALPLTIFGKESLLTAQQRISVEQQKIAEVMSSFFAAAQDDDLPKFHSIVVQDFYIFDNGVRFDGHALMHLWALKDGLAVRLEVVVDVPTILAALQAQT